MTRPLNRPLFLPVHQVDAIVELLAQMLVLDYQADLKNTVGFPPQTDRSLRPVSSCATDINLLDSAKQTSCIVDDVTYRLQ